MLSLTEKLLALPGVSRQVALAIAQEVEHKPKMLHGSSHGQFIIAMLIM